MAPTKKIRLAIVVSHPIQHFVHFYRALAAEPGIELKVFFCSKIGLKAYHDTEMNAVIKWSGDMVSGYDHEFLPEAESITKVSFKTINNPGINAALKGFAPDAVMLYGYSQTTQLRALLWCRLNRVPALMTGDGNFVTKRSALRAFLRNAALKFILSLVSAFLTVGDQNEQMLAAVGINRAKMFRVPFSIDETTYLDHFNRRAEERQRIRTLHNIADDAFVLLFVGKISARKRAQDLVSAWQAIAEKSSERLNITLLFCGDGPELAELRQQSGAAKANSIFAGFVNTDTLPAYYCAADVLVHPSEHDPHPLVCSEAACIGLPMILSDKVGAVGPTDIARDGENSLVYPCTNIAELAKCINMLHDDKNKYALMSSNSHRIFLQCDMKASVSGILAALRQCVHVESPLP